MKNKLFFVTSFLVFMAVALSIVTATAQQNNKIIAVISKAQWCQICQANGEKVMRELIPVFNQSRVQFIMNDFTNDKQKAILKQC